MKKENEKMTSFKHVCNCGGYAWQLNHRPEKQPHMIWCPQFNEYAEWYKALHEKEVKHEEA